MSFTVTYLATYKDLAPDYVQEIDVAGVVCKIFTTFVERHCSSANGLLNQRFVIDSIDGFAKLSAIAAELLPVELETDDCSLFGHDEDGKYFRVLPKNESMQYNALILPLSREVTLQGANSAETQKHFMDYVQAFNNGTALCGTMISNLERIELEVHDHVDSYSNCFRFA